MPDFYSGIKSSDNTFMTRDEVFEELESLGVHKAIIHFSGGHDEGGTDRIELHRYGKDPLEYREHIWGYVEDENGETVYELVESVHGTWKRPKTRPLTAEEEAEMKLSQSLAAPIYDKYYSFAGEFSVHGVVVWETETRKVIMNHDEYVEVGEHYEEEV